MKGFLSAYGRTAPDAEPFFSLLPEQTVHICSISKSLCAGLRVAFLAFPDRYRELLVSGMLSINLKTVSLNSEIIAELIENVEAKNIERFFHWLRLPAHLASEELELLALQKGIHVLGSHRFAMQNENKSSYVPVSIASPDTEDDLRKGLPEQPFSCIVIYPLFFIVLLMYYHGNPWLSPASTQIPMASI